MEMEEVNIVARLHWKLELEVPPDLHQAQGPLDKLQATVRMERISRSRGKFSRLMSQSILTWTSALVESSLGDDFDDIIVIQFMIRANDSARTSIDCSNESITQI